MKGTYPLSLADFKQVLHPPNCSGLRANYRPRASGSGFFLFGSDLPGLENRIIVRYASPGPDLQPPQKRIIVRFISSWARSPDLQRSCNRSIVRFTPTQQMQPGRFGPSGRGCSEQLFGMFCHHPRSQYHL